MTEPHDENILFHIEAICSLSRIIEPCRPGWNPKFTLCLEDGKWSADIRGPVMYERCDGFQSPEDAVEAMYDRLVDLNRTVHENIMTRLARWTKKTALKIVTK